MLMITGMRDHAQKKENDARANGIIHFKKYQDQITVARRAQEEKREAFTKEWG